ncbi:hypothetical protein, partial [Photobacterium damselae]|uniref:hypothetical protein n=1 Tax=Photobacterium damselae TaxID=38293 RepID=UPI004068BAD9
PEPNTEAHFLAQLAAMTQEMAHSRETEQWMTWFVPSLRKPPPNQRPARSSSMPDHFRFPSLPEDVSAWEEAALRIAGKDYP